MENIYNLLCKEVQRNLEYTKESIKKILENYNVLVEYENGKRTIGDTLVIMEVNNPSFDHIRITKGGIYSSDNVS